MNVLSLGLLMAKNTARTIVMIFGIFVLVFLLMRVLPGDAVDILALEGDLTEEMKMDLRTELGLNEPLYIQFIHWSKSMLRFDFGKSLRFRKPVLEIISSALPVTVRFALISSSVGIVFGSMVAFLAIWLKSRLLASIVEALNIWSTAVPTFCIGFILIFIFVLGLRLMPLSGNMLLPVLILGADIAGQIAKPFYAEMKDTIPSRFVTIALAKGLSYRWTILRHVLPNSLSVFLALSSLIVAGTLGGSMTMEVLFNLPGLGRLAYNAVAGRDYPIIQALTIFIATIVIVINFITDTIAVVIDPRRREKSL